MVDVSAAFGRLLPAPCLVCRLPAARRVCEACVARAAPARARCLRCALPLPVRVDRCAACLREPPPFDAAVAACDYRFPWDELVDDFKSHDAIDRAHALAELLVRAIERDGSPSPDLVVPVPCSRERVRERGYNPAWEIARRVARRLGLASRGDALRRIVHAPPQRGLTRAERLRNLRGAFDVAPRCRSLFHGRCIALVDDVMTTTATATEATHALQAVGARAVRVWVAARTPRPDDHAA